jgi:hypothetical protein
MIQRFSAQHFYKYKRSTLEEQSVGSPDSMENLHELHISCLLGQEITKKSKLIAWLRIVMTQEPLLPGPDQHLRQNTPRGDIRSRYMTLAICFWVPFM